MKPWNGPAEARARLRAGAEPYDRNPEVRQRAEDAYMARQREQGVMDDSITPWHHLYVWAQDSWVCEVMDVEL